MLHILGNFHNAILFFRISSGHHHPKIYVQVSLSDVFILCSYIKFHFFSFFHSFNLLIIIKSTLSYHVRVRGFHVGLWFNLKYFCHSRVSLSPNRSAVNCKKYRKEKFPINIIKNSLFDNYIKFCYFINYSKIILIFFMGMTSTSVLSCETYRFV